MRLLFLIFLGIVVMLSACQSKKLPIIGEARMVKKIVNGVEVQEAVHPAIPDFSFTNQYGEVITKESFDGKIYVADFFFTTCPTICPIMKKNMLRVYKAYKEESQVGILSHTIDPEHDSVEVLHEYAKDLGVTGSMWHFVTGDREQIYQIAENHYLIGSVKKDANEAGGYIHSGAFVLVDKEKKVRGLYDGTDELAVRQLVRDITTLLNE